MQQLKHDEPKAYKKMVTMLIEEAREKECTEISLDATEQGRFLYIQLGFTANESGMVLNLK